MIMRRLTSAPATLSAALAALMVATPAWAEIPQLRVQSGGFDIRLTAGAAAQGAVHEDDDPNSEGRGGEIDLFARINAEWTSPSGIVIGANIEQSNQKRETESLDTGEIYAFVASDYGRIEVGRQDGPADTLSFTAPVIALGQVRGDFSRYAGTQALLKAQDTRDAFKIIYLSPPISGLRAGISWSPEVRQNADALNPRSRTLVDNAIELGVQYQRPVGDWILGLSGGYAFGQAKAITTRADLNSWSIGTEARRGPLRIGAAYVSRGNSNRLERDFDQWEINGGVGWVEDRWGVSSSIAFTEASSLSNRLIGVGAFYAFTPNVQLRSDVVYFREKRTGFAVENGAVAMLEIQFTI